MSIPFKPARIGIALMALLLAFAFTVGTNGEIVGREARGYNLNVRQ